MRWLDIFPESSIVKALECFDWVENPTTPVPENENANRFSEHGSLRRRAFVPIAAVVEDERAEGEEDRGEDE